MVGGGEGTVVPADAARVAYEETRPPPRRARDGLRPRALGHEVVERAVRADQLALVAGDGLRPHPQEAIRQSAVLLGSAVVGVAERLIGIGRLASGVVAGLAGG